MGFKLRSGNKVNFKEIGSSPVRNMKDGDYSQSFEKPGPPQTTEFTHNWDGGDATSLIQEKKEKQDAINDAADGKAVDKDAEGNVKTEENTGSSAGAELKTTSDKYEEGGDLKEGDKKWHETDAFRNTGAGHITDAVKSIAKGIKNIKAKKAKRVEEAKKAEGEGTETLKQAKLVKRARKKESRAIKREIKDQKKLAKFRKKNPKQDYTGKSATPSPGVANTDIKPE